MLASGLTKRLDSSKLLRTGSGFNHARQEQIVQGLRTFYEIVKLVAKPDNLHLKVQH